MAEKVKINYDNLKWLDINEYIPPYDTHVIVYNEKSHEMCVAFNQCYDTVCMSPIIPEEWRNNFLEQYYSNIPFKITHWFPIPWFVSPRTVNNSV